MLSKGNLAKKATWPWGELMGGQDVKHGKHLSSKKTHRDKNGRGEAMAVQGQRTSGTLGRFMTKGKQTSARAQ